MAYYTQKLQIAYQLIKCCIPADHYVLYGCFANISTYDDMSKSIAFDQAWWSSRMLRARCLQIDQIKELPNLVIFACKIFI